MNLGWMNSNGAYKTQRADPKTAVFGWKTDLPKTLIKEVESYCRDTMKDLGYTDSEHLKTNEHVPSIFREDSS